MIDTIFGIKISQTHTYSSGGERIPVTKVKLGNLYVTGIKTQDKDGYDAIQIGFGQRKFKNVHKPFMGHLKKAGLGENPPLFLREVRISNTEDSENIKLGDTLNYLDIIKIGDFVQISGVSKGKGFQGGVKRHHFKGGPRTHGQSDRERAPGAIGQTTTPGRVYKGKRMAGRMGHDTVTIHNLKIVDLDKEKNIMTVSGLIPGGKNSFVIIKKIKNSKS